MFCDVDSFQMMKVQIEQMSAKISALQACLVHAQVLSDEMVQVQLHRQRFHAVCKTSQWSPNTNSQLRDILHVGSNGNSIAAFAANDTRPLSLSCCDTLRLFHKYSSLLYVIGGVNADDASIDIVQRFHPCSGTWDILPQTMPIQGRHFAAALLNGSIYLCGVGVEAFSGRVMLFDPCAPPPRHWKIQARSHGQQRLVGNKRLLFMHANSICVVGPLLALAKP